VTPLQNIGSTATQQKEISSVKKKKKKLGTVCKKTPVGAAEMKYLVSNKH
jgi:hypothetical protein